MNNLFPSAWKPLNRSPVQRWTDYINKLQAYLPLWLDLQCTRVQSQLLLLMAATAGHKLTWGPGASISFASADVESFSGMLIESLDVCILCGFTLMDKSKSETWKPLTVFSFSSSCKHHPQQLEPGQWEGSQKHIRKWKAYISSCTTKTCTDWWVNGHLR